MSDIKTEHIRPPVPSRDLDWVAYRDGEEDGPRGFGATEQKAIESLLELESH